MSWLTRPEQACMAVQIIICFNWVHNIRVYNCARVAVSFLVTVVIGPREEDYFVILGNDDECYCRVEVKACTRVCGWRLRGGEGDQ